MHHLLTTLLLSTLHFTTPQPNPTVKYHFFCGSDFADIQTDTCPGRQWCPSASDDECLVPGHTCFANTPCDARLIDGISVPTYSLSRYPEYKDATDKMFCGEDYSEALSVCEVGDEKAQGRHCPNGIDDCPSGQSCFIDMPCSYFVMTSPLIAELNVNPNDVPVEEVALPDPGSLESHYFCGPTFSQAAESCSSKTWCRGGTNQECPNGEICFVSVDTENPKCEINAIVKAEYEANLMAQAEIESQPMVPTRIPTLSPITASDDRNKLFCGFDWNDASSNCDLSRFCPGGTDEECPTGMSCQEYTTCDASGLTGMPSGSPTKEPTASPTERERIPTSSPTTAKPSREPTPSPISSPTVKPTNAPSKKPTYAPLPYGDFRREFWCGLDYFDAINNCSQKCPSGDDADCPGKLLCMSGIKECKNEMGFGAYSYEDMGISEAPVSVPFEEEEEAGDENDEGQDEQGMDGESGTGSTTAAATTTELVFISTGENNTETADATTTVPATTAAATTESGVTNPPPPPMEGPYTDENVRIILYGINLLDTAALNRWSTLTANYFEGFFNDYDDEEDVIRSNITDMAIKISNVNQEIPPEHKFNPLSESSKRYNLRQRRLQLEDDDENNAQTMILFDQTSQFRSYLDVVNDDPQLITRRPLETPVYRAEYVTYLRSVDFAVYGNLTFVSHFLYTDFPTPAPSESPTPMPSVSPVIPGEPTQAPNTEEPSGTPTEEPTSGASENMVCNLCRPGQYGVNADIIWDGEVSSCVDIYNYFLTNHKEGGPVCRQGQAELSSTCCSDGEPGAQQPAGEPASPPSNSNKPEENVQVTVNEPEQEPSKPEENVQVTVDTPEPTKEDNGLPPVTDLTETYYCGANWNSVDCSTATACPDGDKNVCPDDEECIAFTNCGGSFTFVNDPNVEGGGPNVDAVKSTFFCGTSMQFLEMKCEGATPCPNGPKDCTGDEEGCFAFTGCNEAVDPGSFVGFLAKPPADAKPATQAKQTFFCGANWDDLDSRCNENGVPVGATACPSGDILECPDGYGCFAFACNNVVLDESIAVPAASPSSESASEFSVEDINTLKTTFFCGTSIEAIDSDCDNAKPCPNGDECDADAGEGCFAFSQCGGVNIGALVDTFGRTDPPTRAPTPPIEQVCDESLKMSVQLGYWQSWSIWREDDCQKMDTSNWDASPYNYVVYSFASIDSRYRLEPWDGMYDSEVPLYQEFNTVKQRKPGIKTMIAVGGWTHNDPGPMQKRFSEMASSQANRRTFAQSVVKFLRTYGFDGLDLDWEYPGLPERGGTRADYDNYVLMAKEIRSAFNAAPEDYALSVALCGNTTKLEIGFNLAGLAEHIDWFGLMAYDLWGSWDPKQIAYSHTDIRMIDEAIDYMAHFVQKSQIVMGLGSYARTYTLTDDDCLELGCPFEGPGKAGCEGTDGFLPYFEIADLTSSRQFDKVYFDEESESMVMITDGNRLISYDNTVSFNKKIEYSEENCLQGTMVWAIDMLKDTSNPLSSNNGNSALTGDPSDQSFCGRDYRDVITSCRQPCRSGSSDECPADQTCFTNTGCSIDNIGAAPPTKCRLCPDPSTQGMKTWLEVDYGGNTTTCGDADLEVINTFATGTSECDAAKDALKDQCCYTYPENPCMLCRTETEFMDLNALAEVEFNGKSMTCFELSTFLGPESADSGVCLDAQAQLFDQCCFNQCKMCEGQGVRWWVEVEFNDDTLNCGELDSVLYKNSTEEEDELCSEVQSTHSEECCYDYPENPCDICTSGGRKLTLIPQDELEFDGTTYTCAEVNNFVSVFDEASPQCEVAISEGADSCCFDRCSLCGSGARLDFDVFVDMDGEEQTTCADIEAGLLQEKVTSDNENCTETRTLYYDQCCFEIPNDPCELCANDEYMRFSEIVNFNGDEVSCRSVNNHLMERADETSQLCSDTRAEQKESCCYKPCNICGDANLDWDVFINYEGEDVSCGDLTEIFREAQTVDGSEECSAIASELRDTCCYTSPVTSCQLCKHSGIFYEVDDKVQVDFNGPTTCKEVANFLTRRIEETDNMCSTTQASYYEDCCFDKCMLVNAEGAYPDWTAKVEMDGKSATCFDIDNAINEASIVKGSEDCTRLQDAFSETCSYSIPSNACDICPDNDVSPTVTVEYEGSEMKCSDVQSRLASREEIDGDKCVAAQGSLQDCCFDQCHLCSDEQEIDTTHTIYFNGKTIPCSETEDIYNEKSVLATSEQCSADQASFSEECCYTPPKTPCNICKRGEEWFDVMGTNSVTFDNKKQSCSDISDNISKRNEDDSDTCSEARSSLFDSCCDTKCSLCGEKGLDAGVQVSYEGRTMTCLEIDLGISVEEGSEQCTALTTQFSDQCCFEKPETPCRICGGPGQSIDTTAEVFYLGTNTTCDNLSNYLGSREEQEGATCQAAMSDFADSCCYDQCTLCGEGKADWNTYVSYKESSIACGDFEWILRGDNVAADSDECTSVKDQFYEKCCYEPLSTSCNLCQIGGEYLDVQPEVTVDYQGESTTCLNVYNSLFVREAAESEQCNAAKDSLGEECCFQKCKLCQNAFIDTTASVSVDGNDVSCSALDLSFTQSVIMDGSEECGTMQQNYADECCYTLPDNPCRLCSGAYEASGDVMVDFYGEQKTCSEISNKLALSEEAGSESCSSVQNDFVDSCCYEKCPICPTGSNLNWERDVEYNKAIISCGQFDTIIKSDFIAKGSEECNSILSIYSSTCCYNYATSTGGGASTQENVAPPPPPDVDFSEVESTAQGTVTIQKEVGDAVSAGDTIATIGAILPPPPPDAAFTEVQSNKDGTVNMQKEVGEAVNKGDTIATVGEVPPPPPPDAGFTQVDSDAEGTVTLQKEVGDTVAAGETIATIGRNPPPPPPEADFTEVQSNKDGAINMQKEVGEAVNKGDTIATVGEVAPPPSDAGFTQVDSDTEGTVTMQKEVGDTVTAGETIATVGETAPPPPDVSFTEAQSKKDGAVAIQKEAGEAVAAGDIIAIVGTPLPPPDAEFSQIESTSEGTVTMEKQAGDAVVAGETIATVVTTSLPPPDVEYTQAESTTEGIVTSQKEIGDKVAAGETIAIVGSNSGPEVEVKATNDGYVAAVLTEVGANVQNGEAVALIAKDEADIQTVQDYANDLATAEVVEVKATEDGFVAAVLADDSGKVQNGTGVALITANEADIESVKAYADEVAASEVKAAEDGFVAAILPQDGQDVKNGETVALIAKDEADIQTVQQYANDLANTEVVEVKATEDGIVAAVLTDESGKVQSGSGVALIAQDEAHIQTAQDYADDVAASEVKATEDGFVAAVIPQDGQDVKNGETVALIAKDEASMQTVQEYANDLANSEVVEVKATEDGIVAAVLTDESGKVQCGSGVALIAQDEAHIQTAQDYADDVAASEVKATEDGFVAAFIPQDGQNVQNGETVALIAKDEADVQAVQEYADDLAKADAGVEIKATEDGYVAAILPEEGGRVEEGETVALVAAEESDVETLQDYANDLAASEANGPSGTSSYAAPCSLCEMGEITVNTDILFNGVQTSCLEVYNFLATQTQAGSDTCDSGKDALHDACCIQKCDICSGGGIPDWYASVNINGNAMTCLELDGVLTNSQIEQGSDHCQQVLDAAAAACCYEPPTTPCNICQMDTDILHVKTETSVEYGGSVATCGQIFNALYTREEAESQTCSMVSADLASQCCYDKCSLCGDLQIDAATSVDHSGTMFGCGEFDSFIFASNLITEGTDECTMFQEEYRDTCCYDIPCDLCSKKGKRYSTKEEGSVTYGGTATTCSDVSAFLAQDMSQSSSCLVAKENIFDDCCFQPCEMCPGAGESINWASQTMFNGVTQSCTDVYWMLINDGIESTDPVCNGVSRLAADCCFKMPTYQCTLCRDENGVTYNTRWMEEVTVGGVTKTCGDFNTLLSTQEADSMTCTSARESIFDTCCFAGSEQLVAESKTNPVSVSTDEPDKDAFDPNACQLCPVGQVGIDADVTFNGNPTTCLEIYNFLNEKYNKVSESCTSAQSQVADSCCREPSEMKPGENAAFGQMSPDGEPVSAPSGNAITPPTDFTHLNAWTVKASARGRSKITGLCSVITSAITLLALLM